MFIYTKLDTLYNNHCILKIKIKNSGASSIIKYRTQFSMWLFSSELTAMWPFILDNFYRKPQLGLISLFTVKMYSIKKGVYTIKIIFQNTQLKYWFTSLECDPIPDSLLKSCMYFFFIFMYVFFTRLLHS